MKKLILVTLAVLLVASFAVPANATKYIAIIIDASGSMGRMLDDAKDGAEKLITEADPDVYFTIISFSKRINVIQERWSNDKRSALNAVRSIELESTTALYDAVYHSSNLFTDLKGSKMMVVLTDGKDDDGRGGGQSRHNLQDAVGKAVYNNIAIFSIGLGDGADETTLKGLSNSTDGEYYGVRNSGDLIKTYDQIWRDYSDKFATRQSKKMGTMIVRFVGGAEGLEIGGERINIYGKLVKYDGDQIFRYSKVHAGLVDVKVAFAKSQWIGAVEVEAGGESRITVREGMPDKVDFSADAKLVNGWYTQDSMDFTWKYDRNTPNMFTKVETVLLKDGQEYKSDVVDADVAKKTVVFPKDGEYTIKFRPKWDDEALGHFSQASVKVDRKCSVSVSSCVVVADDDKEYEQFKVTGKKMLLDSTPTFKWDYDDDVELAGLGGFSWKIVMDGDDLVPWQQISDSEVTIPKEIFIESMKEYEFHVRAFDLAGNFTPGHKMFSYFWAADEMDQYKATQSGGGSGRPDWVR